MKPIAIFEILIWLYFIIKLYIVRLPSAIICSSMMKNPRFSIIEEWMTGLSNEMNFECHGAYNQKRITV